MAMQNYSGVGNFLEKIAMTSCACDNTPAVGDISGFGLAMTEQNESMLELALQAKDILVSCLAELHQHDELHGVLCHSSALSLKQNMTNLESFHEDHSDDTLPMLLNLDMNLQSLMTDNASADTAKVVTCLEDLGLEHVKSSYMKAMSSSTNVDFSEKWFEDALIRTSQWDDSLLKLPDDSVLAMSTQGATTATTTTMLAHDLLAPILGSSPGFNESSYRALQSLVREDVSGCYSAIAQARETVLHDIKRMSDSAAHTSMLDHLIKFNICNSLTASCGVIEGKTSLQSILRTLGINKESGLKSLLLELDESSLDVSDQAAAASDGDFFRLLRLENSMKEVLVSVLVKQFPGNRECISEALAAHIKTSCRMYRDIGRFDAAKQSLFRLRKVLQVFEVPQPVIPLSLRLEDAKVMACQNDVESAITHCKTIVNHLSNIQVEDTDCSHLLARSLLLGGCFMAHEHVDSVEVMESFFERAATLSHRMQEQDSNASILPTAVAYFKLGEFASAIYGSIDARVSTEAWNQRKSSLVEREKEHAALQAEYPQLQKKYKRTNKQADFDAYNNACRKLTEMQREMDLEKRELSGNHKNLLKYLR